MTDPHTNLNKHRHRIRNEHRDGSRSRCGLLQPPARPQYP